MSGREKVFVGRKVMYYIKVPRWKKLPGSKRHYVSHTPLGSMEVYKTSTTGEWCFYSQLTADKNKTGVRYFKGMIEAKNHAHRVYVSILRTLLVRECC